MLPNVVAPEQLHMANGMLMSMRVLTALAGPLLAGALIAFSGDSAPSGAGMADARGLGLAVALDAFSFAVAIWTLQRVRLHAGVPREMLGRTMSIFMFILMGLAPLAASLTGMAMQRVTLAQLFVGAGLFVVAGALLAFALTPMRVMNDPKSATIPGSTPTT